MKKYFIIVAIVFLVTSACKQTALPKPKNLIDEDIMVDILYDVAIIEAIKVSQPFSLQSKGIDAKTYIYKKYKIDSIQFAKSDKFYAIDVQQYAKMYQQVIDKIKAQKTKDSLAIIPKSVKINKKKTI